MPFGLTNASSTFMQLTNEVLKEFLGRFVIVYLDDTLIFSKTLEDHMMHIHKVFEKLREKKLLINLKKCSFVKKEKVKAILEWPTPRSVTEVGSFHGLTSVYKKIIRGFSNFVDP